MNEPFSTIFVPVDPVNGCPTNVNVPEALDGVRRPTVSEPLPTISAAVQVPALVSTWNDSGTLGPIVNVSPVSPNPKLTEVEPS